MATSVSGSRYNDLEALAAGNKSNLKKRILTPDNLPKRQAPKAQQCQGID